MRLYDKDRKNREKTLFSNVSESIICSIDRHKMSEKLKFNDS
jgi:hypothetical protein